MQEIRKTFETVEYQAVDGRIFNSKEECEKYERLYLRSNEYKAVVDSLIISSFWSPWWTSYDTTYDILKVRTLDEFNAVKNYYESISYDYAAPAYEFTPGLLVVASDCENHLYGITDLKTLQRDFEQMKRAFEAADKELADKNS